MVKQYTKAQNNHQANRVALGHAHSAEEATRKKAPAPATSSQAEREAACKEYNFRYRDRVIFEGRPSPVFVIEQITDDGYLLLGGCPDKIAANRMRPATE
jgi:hypothetical protein